MAAPTRTLARDPQRAIWSSHPRSCWMSAAPGMPDEVGRTLTWANSPLGSWTGAIAPPFARGKRGSRPLKPTYARGAPRFATGLFRISWRFLGLGSARRSPPPAARTVSALAADPRSELGRSRHAVAQRLFRVAVKASRMVGLRFEAAAPPSGDLSQAPDPFQVLGWLAGVVPSRVFSGELVCQVPERVTAGQ